MRMARLHGWPLVTLALGAASPARAQGVEELTWPRTLTAADGMQVTFYQPQVDSWSYYVVLDYHMAVELQLPGASSSVPASLFMTAETSTNLGAQTVALYNQKIVRMNFPGLDPATAQQYQGIVQSLIPAGSMNLSLPQVQSYMSRLAPGGRDRGAASRRGGPGTRSWAGTAAHAAAAGAADLLQPVTRHPGDLSGQACLRPGDPGVATVLLRQHQLGGVSGQEHRYLLSAGPGQLAAGAEREWTLAGGGTVALEPDEPARRTTSGPTSPRTFRGCPGGPAQVPNVFVSQKPAELILLEGPAQLQGIPGTSLSWVTNTESDLFFYSPSSQWYFLVSGRWFSARSMNGPWTYATPSLPADFSNIPADSPRAAVLSSVPGTPQADEAVAQAQMPHKADVDIATTTVDVTYGGPPQFSPIQGTSMQYATNTSYEVIQASGNYYVCSNGVWFVSPSPNGPFAVATMVPQVIYTIPPSSPMYNVTYVQIYESTPTTVVVGYTSGYNGAYVAAGVVMLGVGMALAYSYHPYYPPGFGYPVYYHPPYPYTATATTPRTTPTPARTLTGTPRTDPTAGPAPEPDTTRAPARMRAAHRRLARTAPPPPRRRTTRAPAPAPRPTSIPMPMARMGLRSRRRMVKRRGRATRRMPTAPPVRSRHPREARRQVSLRRTARRLPGRRRTTTCTPPTTGTSIRTPEVAGSRAAAADGIPLTSRVKRPATKRRAARPPRNRRATAPGRAVAAASTVAGAVADTAAGTVVAAVAVAAPLTCRIVREK